MGQTRIHHEGVVGPVEIVARCQCHGARHALTAPLGVFGHGQPLPLHKNLVGAFERLGHPDLSALELAPLLITLFTGRQDLLDGQVTGLGDDQIDGFSAELGKFIVLAKLADLQLLVKDEIDIPAIRDLLCHDTHLLIMGLIVYNSAFYQLFRPIPLMNKSTRGSAIEIRSYLPPEWIQELMTSSTAPLIIRLTRLT